VNSVLSNNPFLLNEELDAGGSTALYVACCYNQSPTVSFLLEQKAIDVNKSINVNDNNIIIADVSHLLICYSFLNFCRMVGLL
jgi:ankyrin repeat protein